MDRIYRKKSNIYNQKDNYFDNNTTIIPLNPLLADIYSLQNTIGNQEVQRLINHNKIMGKFFFSQPGDMYEQEADRVADQIAGMKDKPVREKFDRPYIMNKSTSVNNPALSSSQETDINSLNGKGDPLQKSIREYFEPRFGVDLGNVRIHKESNADKLARAMRARAFVQGKNIVFAEGQYKPETTAGKKLIAHELTHVLQQGEMIHGNYIQREIDDDIRQRFDISGYESVLDESPVEDNLARNDVLERYKACARDYLNFSLDAMYQWINIVIRPQYISDSGEIHAASIDRLREAAVVANELASVVWDENQNVLAWDELINKVLPPQQDLYPGSIHSQTTQGSIQHIRSTFSNIVQDALRQLGRPQVSEEEIDEYIINNATDLELYYEGFDTLVEQGKVRGWYATPEWTGREYSPEEVRAIGLLTIQQNADQRERAGRQLIIEISTSDSVQEEQLYLDQRVSREYQGYNYFALNFVLQRFREERVQALQLARTNLEQHFDTFPLLRMYISNWDVILNELIPFEYRDIIDPGSITSDNIISRLDTLLDDLAELKNHMNENDDFLFDTAVIEPLRPIILEFGLVNSSYRDWILEEFENKALWREFTDRLILIGSILAFGLTGMLTGGLAYLAGGVGAAGLWSLAVRSSNRADILGMSFHAGLTTHEQASVARFKAWLDTAIAVLGTIQALVRPIRDAINAYRVGNMSRIQVNATFVSSSLTSQERAQLQVWQRHLQNVVDRAVHIVDAGNGTTRWATIYNQTGSALARGNAIHYEVFELLRNSSVSSQSTLVGNILMNRGVSVPGMGFTNSFSGLRPDIRIALSGGRELIFDITSIAQLGHTGTKYLKQWVMSMIELGY